MRLFQDWEVYNNMARGKVDFSKALQQSNEEQRLTENSPLKNILEEQIPVIEDDNKTVKENNNVKESQFEPVNIPDDFMNLPEGEEFEEPSVKEELKNPSVKEEFIESSEAVDKISFQTAIQESEKFSIKETLNNESVMKQFDEDTVKDKYTCYSITEDIYMFIKDRARELNLSSRKYVIILLTEYRNKIEQNGITLNKELKKTIEDEKKRKRSYPVVIPEELFEWARAAAAAHKLNYSDFFTYIVISEKQREEKEGKRKSKYEEKYNFVINN
jgi:hypothetical protein